MKQLLTVAFEKTFITAIYTIIDVVTYPAIRYTPVYAICKAPIIETQILAPFPKSLTFYV